MTTPPDPKLDPNQRPECQAALQKLRDDFAAANARGEEADTIEELVEALEPFARAARLSDAAGLNKPDDQPCRDWFPGIWPTRGDCRRAVRVLAKIGGEA